VATTTNKTPTKPGNRWAKLAMAITLAVAALAAVVLIAQWMRTLQPVQDFLTTYPGKVDLPEGAPAGLPTWLGWQHFLNAFFLVLIIRSGWLVRTTARPKEYWTRNNSGPIRTKGKPAKISLNLWFHLTLDALWVANGAVFIILLLVTGQWMRIVPTSWDVFPNALSTAIQYASLNWPTENGWVNYNSLQVLAYFSIVFIAAPLALATGLRMSGAWPKNAHALNKAYPIEAARAIHFPVMLYFVGFVVVHVALVFATGFLHNLNHMYAANDGAGWAGFWIFAASVAVMVAAWFLARPLFLRPVASVFGKVTR
jgi:thiosulfate reductase cytochrome b subunit